jgi:hypothetical protein
MFDPIKVAGEKGDTSKAKEAYSKVWRHNDYSSVHY